MVYYLVMFGSFVLVIVAVFSVILSYMDSKRMRAFISAKALKEHLDVIVRFIVGQAHKQYNDTVSGSQLQELADRYSGLKKNRDALEIIPLANSIVSLYNSLEISVSMQNDAGVRGELSDALEIIGLLREEYNDSVESLNKQLNKRLQANLGRLFRMKKLEKLCDLSNLLSGV